MPPLKPEVCIVGNRLAVFMAADYKLLDRPAAKAFVKAVQRGYAQLLREGKASEEDRAMRMKADGSAHQAWALRELHSHHIDLTTVSETERMANALLYARRLYQPHRPACEVVPVNLQLSRVDR